MMVSHYVPLLHVRVEWKEVLCEPDGSNFPLAHEYIPKCGLSLLRFVRWA